MPEVQHQKRGHVTNKFLNKSTEAAPKSSKLSDFVLHASSRDKKKVFTQVLKASSAEQRKVIERAAAMQ